MKTEFSKKTLKYLLGIGVIVSIYSFGFVQGSIAGDDGSKILLPEAEAYHDNYMKTAREINGAVGAYYLDLSTLNDLNDLKKQTSSLDGIRVYFGKDVNNKPANVLVAVKDGKDLVKDYIMKSTGKSDICPNACDSESPIQKSE